MGMCHNSQAYFFCLFYCSFSSGKPFFLPGLAGITCYSDFLVKRCFLPKPVRTILKTPRGLMGNGAGGSGLLGQKREAGELACGGRGSAALERVESFT